MKTTCHPLVWQLVTHYWASCQNQTFNLHGIYSQEMLPKECFYWPEVAPTTKLLTRWQQDDKLPVGELSCFTNNMPSLKVWPLTPLAMDELSLEQHVSKTEAAEIYRRGLRSLTREISKSLASRDEKVLSNWRLKTIDGEIRQGTKVTSEEVESLHSMGMVPTWWGYEPYLEAKFGRRDAEDDSASVPKQSTDHKATGQQSVNTSGDLQGNTALPPLPQDDAEAVAVLKDFSLRLLNDLDRERSRYDEVIPVIKNMPEQHKNTMAVLKGLQDTLKNAQFLGLSDEDKKSIHALLSSGKTQSTPGYPKTTKRAPGENTASNQVPANEGEDKSAPETANQAQVIDVDPVAKAQEMSAPVATKPAKVIRRSKTKRTVGKKSPAKKQSTNSKPKKTKSKKQPKSTARKGSRAGSKWFPTFSRLLSSKK